jgi:uncharacterized protein YpmB
MPNSTLDLVIMLFSAVLGGTGAKLIEVLSKRKSEKIYQNEISHSKVELRLELEKLKNRLLVSENELLIWQAKYYETLEKLAKVNYELSELLNRLHIH